MISISWSRNSTENWIHNGHRSASGLPRKVRLGGTADKKGTAKVLPMTIDRRNRAWKYKHNTSESNTIVYCRKWSQNRYLHVATRAKEWTNRSENTGSGDAATFTNLRSNHGKPGVLRFSAPTTHYHQSRACSTTPAVNPQVGAARDVAVLSWLPHTAVLIDWQNLVSHSQTHYHPIITSNSRKFGVSGDHLETKEPR